MKLILIRHGKTLANEQHLYCGLTDLPLSDAGRLQLEARKNSVDYPSIAGMRVLTSGMKRCDETLTLLYGETRHEAAPAFREMDFGEFEMHSYSEMKDEPRYIEWISGDNEANLTPGGESGNLMKKRVLDALEQLLHDGRDAAVFTHGGVIAAVMEQLFLDEGKNRYEWQPEPGGGYLIDTETKIYFAI